MSLSCATRAKDLIKRIEDVEDVSTEDVVFELTHKTFEYDVLFA
jgi:hypothetical protein